MQKNTLSSTHLVMGPMPSACRMSLAASAQVPYMPAEGASPKDRQMSMLKASLPTLTTVPFHWEWWSGMVRYASASSLVAASDPGGSQEILRAMVEKVPQVQG